MKLLCWHFFIETGCCLKKHQITLKEVRSAGWNGRINGETPWLQISIPALDPSAAVLDAKRTGEEVWMMCEPLQSFPQSISQWELKICWSPKLAALLPLPATSMSGSWGKLKSSISTDTKLILFPPFYFVPSQTQWRLKWVLQMSLLERKHDGSVGLQQNSPIPVSRGFCYIIQNCRNVTKNRNIIFFTIPFSKLQMSHLLVQNKGTWGWIWVVPDLQTFKALDNQCNFLISWLSISL